jgi:hypothetical protein
MNPLSVPLMAPPEAWKISRWMAGSTDLSVDSASAVDLADTMAAPAQSAVTASMPASQRVRKNSSVLTADAAGR